MTFGPRNPRSAPIIFPTCFGPVVTSSVYVASAARSHAHVSAQASIYAGLASPLVCLNSTL